MQPRKNRGGLFIISAPSGAGKTSLCAKALSHMPNLSFSVSFTTRRPRPGEVNNKDYTFVGRETFKSMAEEGGFAEWAEVHGELYGTSSERLEMLMQSGSDVLLDIDTQGAMQMKRNYPEGVYIFILPPSLEALRKRLEERMTDSGDEILKRFRRACSEIRTYTEYDYVIINDIFEDALNELMSVLNAQRARAHNINPLWIKERFLNEEVR